MDSDIGIASEASLPAFNNATANTLPTSVVAQNAAQLAMESLGELLRIVLHDLANPLQSITMQLELLEDTHSESPGLRKQVDSMLDTAEEFNAMLGSISAFFHRPAPSTTACHARESVNRLKALLEARLNHRGIRWEAELSLVPAVAQPCAELELILLHILILTACARRDPGETPLVLRTAFAMPPPPSGGAPRIRVHFTLTGSSSAPQPVVMASDHETLTNLARRMSPGASIQSFPDGSIQFDLQLLSKDSPYDPSV